MNLLRLLLIAMGMTPLCMMGWCRGADLFASEQERKGFLKALVEQDARYETEGKQ